MPYICDRCGFRFDRLRKEWTGLMVCEADWDPKPADHSPPKIGPEGLPRPNARPEPVPIFLSPGDVSPDDL